MADHYYKFCSHCSKETSHINSYCRVHQDKEVFEYTKLTWGSKLVGTYEDNVESGKWRPYVDTINTPLQKGEGPNG